MAGLLLRRSHGGPQVEGLVCMPKKSNDRTGTRRPAVWTSQDFAGSALAVHKFVHRAVHMHRATCWLTRLACWHALSAPHTIAVHCRCRACRRAGSASTARPVAHIWLIHIHVYSSTYCARVRAAMTARDSYIYTPRAAGSRVPIARQHVAFGGAFRSVCFINSFCTLCLRKKRQGSWR